MAAARRTGWRQWWQRQVRRHVWAMDIHPSAWIAPTALIDRTWPKGIHIGAGCVLGEEAVVLTHDLTRGLYLDTRIGEGTLVGARAIILPGISVGRDCVIQPGALVNRDVPDFHVASGNPASISPRP
ncbi:acyltransferase [Sandarakinorhabdus rubra]|uniref:acyltransferase n=1 Tax=Sandarakinorhabdus rubra TaxID=2672568 RepID=UPI0013D91CF0|nr:DapH/DapD/GlmU-related protein [Sandarakinorhabdus rubra]